VVIHLLQTMLMMHIRKLSFLFFLLFLCGCSSSDQSSKKTADDKKTNAIVIEKVTLDIHQANRLSSLPLECIQNPLPYKSGVVIASPEDLAMPQEHHPAFYGCFDWHSAVHGHWSLIYLLKTFPNLADREQIVMKLQQNLTAQNIEKEVAYFSLNKESTSFERTYGWAWLLKLQEELYTWDDPFAKQLYKNLVPLAEYISRAYVEYLPKLYYPIRVGEHSNTAFGLSFAYDYAKAVGDIELTSSIRESALRFYSNDSNCPISWEPSGYDFLSPCLQELDIMRKVLDDKTYAVWSREFMPELFDGNLSLEPGKIIDRSDGKLVHLDGLNFSRAWCLYSLNEKENQLIQELASNHLSYSLSKIKDGDYAGQHWLASFALYAFKCQHDYQ